MTEDSTPAAAKPSRFTRALLFLAATLAAAAIIIALMTWWVIGSAPRTQAVAIGEGVAVSEYVTLPDDDAYPAALALAEDGTLYTGSYQTGAIWSISTDGFIRELAGTRNRIGSVSGLDVAADGALIILDRIQALDAKGAVIWRYADGELSSIVRIPNDPASGLVLPDDIALDGAGLMYISDRDPPRIWRYTLAGENLGVWWQAAPDTAPTGLAYDPFSNAILITDSEQDAIYRVAAAANSLSEALDQTEILYQNHDKAGYGLDGITASPAGEVYVALLAWNRVARLDRSELAMLASDFRGASDLVYDSSKDTLFVTNWNQFSLGFGTRPQLPFALDAVDLSPAGVEAK